MKKLFVIMLFVTILVLINQIVSAQNIDPQNRTITTGRAASIIAVIVGIISLIIGWRAKHRSTRDAGSEKTGAIVALALGLIGIVFNGSLEIMVPILYKELKPMRVNAVSPGVNNTTWWDFVT